MIDGENGDMIDAPCCCWACTKNPGQRGHFMCNLPPEGFLEAEEKGLILRVEYDSVWRWLVLTKLVPTQ